jgi:RimJ/RimL family protein N-acetyltransferase
VIVPVDIQTDRLLLTPLTIDTAATAAASMLDVLADPDLYRFTGGQPPTLAELQARYHAQATGSGNADELWLNWIVRHDVAQPSAPQPVGFVQATVTRSTTDTGIAADVAAGVAADVAWLIGSSWQGRGFAREAATALCIWLREAGVDRISAHVHPDHSASAAVARACGMEPTGTFDADGEHVWSWNAGR